MDINQLKYFQKDARLQHMTRAAAELHVAQPALSQVISKLEAELSVPLFMPNGRNIVLTDYGAELLNVVEPIIEDFDNIKKQMSKLKEEQDNTININVLAASRIVTDAILNYRKENDSVAFNFSQVETKNSDIVISTTRDDVSDRDNVAVVNEEIFLAMPKSLLKGDLNGILLKECSEMKFASIYGKGIREITDQYCREAGFYPNIVFESDNTTSVRNFIEAGLGVGFWPSYTWGKRVSKSVDFIAIKYPKCYRNIVIKKNDKKADNGVVNIFYNYLVAYFDKLAL